MAQGVIDPVKVTRSAVLNAASIAGMLLTTEVLVADKPEEDDRGRRGRSRALARPRALSVNRSRTRPPQAPPSDARVVPVGDSAATIARPPISIDSQSAVSH